MSLHFIGGGGEARPVRRCSSLLRQAPWPATHAKPRRQLRWHGGGASTKGCMLPRRCLPSWLGRQLHANGGGDLAGVDLAVALLARLARALPGGPAKVLLRHTVMPGKDLAGGLVAFLGKDLAEDRRLLILT